MTTYSIRLDELDLALLPLRVHNNDFLKKEHFQFQVIKEHAEVPELSDVTYTCHICAINVPAAFAREHNASVKHQTNARIARVATLRTHALISAHPPPLVKQTGRFCVNCATIVDEDHDKTKEHRVAVMHDNLLCELMKAYVGDDDESKNADNNVDNNQNKMHIGGKKDEEYFKIAEENNNINVAMVTQTIKLQSENITDNVVTKVMQPIADCATNDTTSESKSEDFSKDDIPKNNTSANKTENKPPANSVSPTKSQAQTKDVTENGTGQNEPGTSTKNGKGTMEPKAKSAREPYEKELRKFMDSKYQFQIKESYSRIHIKINDDTVNVYSDHFHSFHRIYRNGDIECIVCDSTFNEKNQEAHKYSVNHMSGVVQIGTDGEYVREINEAYSHCILCNQKISNINVAKHKQSQHHTLRKTNNVRSTKPKAAATTDRNIENTSKATTTERNCNKNNVTFDVNEPYEEIKGELQCLVCECRVPKDVRNREDHLKGFRHMNNLKSK
ncbi:probable serine/threonine-protein kinase DDB_G0283337 [Cydia pomonella]|uniref:probable serine/threonine-protein kinase DDB_G0283337 n=1 Tax=Cydia pomonella TaxID=82600 RepID=UPI002ADD3279|nr:probable serine/threonine-protein kinase DDB_G0283337 [Cydia pomonella]